MKKLTYKLAASLICANFMHLERDINALKKSKVDFIHVDIMDGIFVPRYGLFPEIITQVRKNCQIPMDIHMMVEDAESYLETFVNAGVNKKDDIFVIHAESTKHLDRVLQRIKGKGIRAGVALNPATPIHILDYVLPQLDLIVVMAINPGIVGHKLIPGMIRKVADVRAVLSDYPNILLEVDGGVNFESAPKMLEAGANVLVCGTQTIFQPPASISQKVSELRKILE